MRLYINLATQPYEDARRFTTLWTTILGALLLSAVLLSVLVYRRYENYRQVSHAIGIEQRYIDDLDNKQAQGLAILNRPENRDVRERADYLNGLILRKEVSWTNIFTTLEKMMPPHLRVLTIQPMLKDGQIVVSMQLGGDSRERVAELVRRMENSKTFHNAQIISENNQQAVPGQQGSSVLRDEDPMRFAVTAEYISGMNEPEKTAEKQPEKQVADNTAGGGK
jgi:Tfp pilus assembly protein PilN